MEYTRPNYSGLHFHIGIDPYGDLAYEHYDKRPPTSLDYDEQMFAELRKDFAGQKRKRRGTLEVSPTRLNSEMLG